MPSSHIVSSLKPVAFVLGFGLLGAITVPAQQPAAPPNPLGQPLVDANGQVRGEAMLRTPLRPEDRRYAGLDGDRMKTFVDEIAQISVRDRESGNLFWGRNVGTAGHVATQDWVEAHFRRHQLENVYRQPFDLPPQWMPQSYSIRFESGGRSFALESARPSRSESTPGSGLDLEVVWGGTGSAADLAGRDVKGKAVLIQDIPLPGDIRHSAALDGAIERAYEHGAAAVGLIFGISDNFAIWQRTAGRHGFNLGYEDGMQLRELVGKGQPVRVKYQLDAGMRPGLKTASVWGTLPGASDEEVLIIAHLDGYFEAALDNASGVAVMIGLLEHYAKIPRAERPRTIRFLGSAGHHGGPGTRWLHDNRGTALAKTALAINLEHVAAVRSKYWGPRLRMTTAVSPMRWWVNGSPQLLDVVLDSFARFNVGITADMDPGASGEMGPMARDVPSIQVITSPEIKHTEQDTAAWVPAAGLEQIARAYARIIDESARLERRALLPTTN